MWLLEALNGDPEHPSTTSLDTTRDSAKSRQVTCPRQGSREPLTTVFFLSTRLACRPVTCVLSGADGSGFRKRGPQPSREWGDDAAQKPVRVGATCLQGSPTLPLFTQEDCRVPPPGHAPRGVGQGVPALAPTLGMKAPALGGVQEGKS